jgi:lysophospholipase L1-like esterase
VLRPARLVLAAAVLGCALVAASPGAAAGNRNLLSYGDSLSVGTDLFLGGYLRGWRVSSVTAISRHADAVPGGLRSYGRALPRVIVVSAGTNDDPGRVSGFARIVRETLAVAGPTRCVVWSAIVRPPYNGVSYAGYNRALERIARSRPNLRVFDWVSMARTHPSWFGSDGVHPTATGYRARAAAIARLVRGCPG